MRSAVHQLTTLCLALPLLLSGCRPENPQERSSAGATAEVIASGAEAEQAYRVTALTEPEDTEELTILIAGEAPESLNPWRDPSDLELILFPRAIRRNPESLEWEPWMAESWQVAEDRRSV